MNWRNPSSPLRFWIRAATTTGFAWMLAFAAAMSRIGRNEPRSYQEVSETRIWIELIAVLALFLTAGGFIAAPLFAKKNDDASNLRDQFGRTVAALIFAPAVLIASFAVLCHCGWVLYGQAFMIVPPETQSESWIAYGFDNVVRASCLDFLEIYRIDISNIEHADTLIAKTFIFAFRTFLSATFIGYIYFAYRVLKENHDQQSKPVEASDYHDRA